MTPEPPVTTPTSLTKQNFVPKLPLSLGDQQTNQNSLLAKIILMALGGTRGASFYSFTPNDQIFENMSTFKNFMSDFSFLCNRARPCGTQNRIESDNYEFAT